MIMECWEGFGGGTGGLEGKDGFTYRVVGRGTWDSGMGNGMN